MQLISCLRGASLSTEIYFLSPAGLPPQTWEGKSGFSCYRTRPAACAELKLERTQAGRGYSFRVISGFPFKGGFLRGKQTPQSRSTLQRLVTTPAFSPRESN